MVLVILACQGPKLSESMDISKDPMLSDLPSDATFLMGGSIGSLPESPLGRLMKEQKLLPQELAGLPLERWGEGRLGCGSGGCRLLVTGDFRGWEPDFLGAGLLRIPRNPGPWGDGDSDQSHYGLQPARGKALELKMEEGRLLAGDPEVTSGPSAGPLLVPRGDLWFLLRKPLQLRVQAVERLRAEGTVEAEEAAEAMEALSPVLLGSVRQMSWSLDAENPRLVGRLETVSPAAAILWEGMTKLQIERVEHRAESPEVRRLAGRAVLRRLGAVVEVEVRP